MSYLRYHENVDLTFLCAFLFLVPADIDYMNLYRNFENDQATWSYEEGAQFLDRIHENGQHFVPIVDSAIYAPDPGNPDDNYDTFDRGLEADAFMMNPDGSLYIGQVWPGYTGELMLCSWQLYAKGCASLQMN